MNCYFNCFSYFYYLSSLYLSFWSKNCPINIKNKPQIKNIYPYIENDPGIVWTDTKFKKNVAKNGYKVIANAGIIGSENNFDINVKLKYVPKDNITAI